MFLINAHQLHILNIRSGLNTKYTTVHTISMHVITSTSYMYSLVPRPHPPFNMLHAEREERAWERGYYMYMYMYIMLHVYMYITCKDCVIQNNNIIHTSVAIYHPSIYPTLTTARKPLREQGLQFRAYIL